LEKFQALGIEFLSLSGQLDTTTPTGKIVFTVLGALENSLIAERLRAGLRNAKSQGKRLGRQRRVVDAAKIAILQAHGMIAHQLGTIARSARRAGQKTHCRCRLKKSFGY
jgi:DNA invertase Pin-like site-specific DNA recombinase